MNIDPEQILGQIKPGWADGQLRSRILGAVDARLRESQSWRLQKRIGFCTLTMLIFSVGLNFLVNRTVSHQLVALFPPPTPSRQIVELADFVSKHADPRAGQWTYQQLASQSAAKHSPEEYFAYIQKLTYEAENFYKDKFYEKSKKNSPLDRHKPGNVDRDPADIRGMLLMDSRLTA